MKIKNIIILILLLSICLIIVNFFSVKSFYYNYKGDFKNADNWEGDYNLGNIDYEKGNYVKVIEKYKRLSEECLEGKKCFRLNHNIGNTLYKLGEKELDIEKKKKLWKESIGYYDDALKIKNDKETIENKLFVEKKLKEIIHKEEKKKQEKQEEENKKEEEDKQQEKGKKEKTEEQVEGDKSNSKEGKHDKENKDQDKTEKGEKKESGTEQGKTNDQELSENENKLSEQQKNEIKRYEQRLQKEQGQYQEYYNKVYEEKGEGLDDFFANDPFFDNSLLEENEEKDW